MVQPTTTPTNRGAVSESNEIVEKIGGQQGEIGFETHETEGGM